VHYWAGTVCLIAFSATLFGEASVAKASSNEPFVLRGAEVPAHGVPSWPVYPGDDIVAGKALTVLKFGCKARIRLNPGDKANVSPDGKKLFVHLAEGDRTYNLSKGCPVAIVLIGGAAIAAGGATYGILHSDGSSTSDPPAVSAR
jgi:hypothetical protein